jgi:S1-C subfamily serine protease
MLVDSVISGSAAEAAGLMAGDVIVAVGERTILRLEQLQAALAGQNIQFDIRVVRRKQPILLKISAPTSR